MIRRRDFITLLGGAAGAWPIAARAEPAGTRRLGVLMGFAKDDPVRQPWVARFVAAFANLGWMDGRNIRIDYRWVNAEQGGTSDYLAAASELLAMAPDVVFASPQPAAEAIRQQGQTIPIVFAISGDPVRAGLARSYARPGGNATGFTLFEATINTKYLQLLKDIAPDVTRVAIMQTENSAWRGDFAAIESVASTFGVQPVSAIVRDAADIERVITQFAREPNGGLILPPDFVMLGHRRLVVALAAKHRLPAIYATRGFVVTGGLLSYAADQGDVFRRAASYVDRILKGEKTVDLPVQAPTKYETIVNLKTAKALGLDIPPTLLARADEVIE